MSLLTVLGVVVAFVVACGLIAALDKFLRPKLEYPVWIIYFAYGLLALIVVLFVCDQLGIFRLLSSVRAGVGIILPSLW
jgi:hypothetical protein